MFQGGYSKLDSNSFNLTGGESKALPNKGCREDISGMPGYHVKEISHKVRSTGLLQRYGIGCSCNLNSQILTSNSFVVKDESVNLPKKYCSSSSD